MPKFRTGTYFPERLLERRKRVEPAVITVVKDYYFPWVSTRRKDWARWQARSGFVGPMA